MSREQSSDFSTGMSATAETMRADGSDVIESNLFSNDATSEVKHSVGEKNNHPASAQHKSARILTTTDFVESLDLKQVANLDAYAHVNSCKHGRSSSHH